MRIGMRATGRLALMLLLGSTAARGADSAGSVAGESARPPLEAACATRPSYGYASGENSRAVLAAEQLDSLSVHRSWDRTRPWAAHLASLPSAPDRELSRLCVLDHARRENGRRGPGLRTRAPPPPGRPSTSSRPTGRPSTTSRRQSEPSRRPRDRSQDGETSPLTKGKLLGAVAGAVLLGIAGFLLLGPLGAAVGAMIGAGLGLALGDKLF